MRATLYILGGRSVGRSFVVEDSAIIGREPSCQIRLGDKSISRRHARIVWDGFRWRVEDLDSRNGVHLDKQRVKEANLADRDEFMLGEVPVRLRIEDEEAQEASAAPEDDFEFEEDIVVKPRPAAPTPAAPAEEEIVLEEEILLEEEIDLGAPAGEPEAAGLALNRRAGAAGAQESAPKAPIRLAEAPESRLKKDVDPRAKVLAANSKRGFLGGDLSQQPAWVLGILFLVLALIMCGVAYLIFGAIQSLQS
jgi:hypothetical protein